MADADRTGSQSEESLYAETLRLSDKGRHDEALPLYLALTEKWPSVGYYMLLAGCQINLEYWPDGERSARAALELEPEAWTMWRSLATCLESQRRFPEAAAAYERSLGIKDNPCTRVLYAAMLRKTGDEVSERKQLEACTRTFPEWEEAWLNLGGTWEVEDPERALRLMQTSLEIDPQWGYCHAAVAYMHGVLGDVEDARRHLREARRLGSDQPDVHEMLDITSEWLLKIDKKRHPRRKVTPE